MHPFVETEPSHHHIRNSSLAHLCLDIPVMPISPVKHCNLIQRDILLGKLMAEAGSRDRLVVATTFAQAADIARRLGERKAAHIAGTGAQLVVDADLVAGTPAVSAVTLQQVKGDTIRLAFADAEFLTSEDTRGIRFQLEYLKTVAAEERREEPPSAAHPPPRTAR